MTSPLLLAWFILRPCFFFGHMNSRMCGLPEKSFILIFLHNVSDVAFRDTGSDLRISCAAVWNKTSFGKCVGFGLREGLFSWEGPPPHPTHTCTCTFILTYTQEGRAQQWMSRYTEQQEEKTSAPCPAAGNPLKFCVCVCVSVFGWGRCVCDWVCVVW